MLESSVQFRMVELITLLIPENFILYHGVLKVGISIEFLEFLFQVGSVGKESFSLVKFSFDGSTVSTGRV